MLVYFLVHYLRTMIAQEEFDYIIVGCGLAAINFCEKLIANNKTFIVYDNDSQKSSSVAGGLYNPVILKRFTSVWKSKEQLELALPVYEKIEKRLETILDYKVPVYRKFASIEEQNDWFAASDKPKLSPLLSTKIHDNDNENVEAAFGLGEVLDTGRIDTKLLVEVYRAFLKKNQKLKEELFSYNDLQLNENYLSYNEIRAKHIVFAEGFGLKQNPYFKELPLTGVKGELITIHAPDLKINFVLKSSVFIIPIGNDLYRIGSTYDRIDKTNTITEKAKEELLEKLKTLIKCKYEVVNQVAAIRPTTKDRRPLVGRHKDYKNTYVLNGLGTRGVMIGPYVANQLYNFIENDIALNEEINIKRFKAFR